MPAAAEAQLDAVMLETFADETLAHARAFEELHGTMFEHAGAHAMLDVVAASILYDHGFHTMQMEQVGQQQTRRAGADDPYLSTQLSHGAAALSRLCK